MQQQESIDIFVAKLSKDLIDKQFCRTHSGRPAVCMSDDQELLCEECVKMLVEHFQKIETIKLEPFIEQINYKFQTIGEKFHQIHSYYQENSLMEIIETWFSSKIETLRTHVNQEIDKLQQEKYTILMNLQVKRDQAKYNEFKKILETLYENTNNLAEINLLLSDKKIDYVNQLSFQLSSNIEDVVGEIKVKSELLIRKQIDSFIQWLQQCMQIQSETKHYDSMIIPTPQEEEQLQQQNIQQTPIEPISVKERIKKIKDERQVIKLAMRDHLSQVKNQKSHDKIKFDGGGNFGLSFTGGYGVTSQSFNQLDLCTSCSECRNLNKEMERTVKMLYELNYRDGLTWWVQAWFVFNA